jgi:hypothetical protein
MPLSILSSFFLILRLAVEAEEAAAELKKTIQYASFLTKLVTINRFGEYVQANI